MKNKIRIEFDKIPKAFLAATHKVVQEKLFELGYFWGEGERKVNYLDANFLWVNPDTSITWGDDKSFEYPAVNGNHVYIMPGDFDKMVGYLSKKEYLDKIKLNNEYNAVVTADGVKVDCQDFTFEAIEGLYNAVQKAKKENSKVDYFVTQAQ